MENPGMKGRPPVQTKGRRWNRMDTKPQEITLGPVTYEVRRVYGEGHTLTELLAGQITRHTLEDPPFDETRKDAV